LNIDGENIGNTLGNHARLPKQGGQTAACKFDGWLKDWVNERLPKGYAESQISEVGLDIFIPVSGASLLVGYSKPLMLKADKTIKVSGCWQPV
jgi:hypothetical protein